MKIFNEIVKLYNEISDIYFKLLELEIQNKKGDIAFLRLIISLKYKLRKENELFGDFINECDSDYDKIYHIINNFCPDDNIRKRMLGYVMAYECFNVPFDTMDEEEAKEHDIMLKLDKIYMSCCRNIYLIYHSFLQEYIDIDIREYMETGMFDKLKEEILSFKYYNAFVNHDMESQLVMNNFDVPIINYVDVYFIADSLRLKGYEEIILDAYSEAILTSAIEMLSVKDSDYDSKLAVVINNQCMLRAGLALLSESDYAKIQTEISNKIHQLTSYDNVRSVSAVHAVFNRRKKDKERIRKISMKPLNV